MTITIEHMAYSFWDWDSIFPGYNLSDAFQEAGGKVHYPGDDSLNVMGLPQEKAVQIATRYQADYLGPVISKENPKNLKIVPVVKATSQFLQPSRFYYVKSWNCCVLVFS